MGWCAEGPFAPVASDVQKALARAASSLEELGCRLEPVSLAALERRPSQALTTTVYTAEAGHYLETIIAGRHEELTPYIQRRLATPQPSMSEYLAASAELEQIRLDMARFFEDYDLLLCPTGPIHAHEHEASELVIGDERIEARSSLRATIPFDITGSPAISVPFGWSADGLPIGVQLVGRHFQESTVLHAASALEALHDAHRRRPAV